MLQFNDGAWEHRAYWGESKISWGKEGQVSRRKMGPLPETGKWVKLEVDAAHVGLKPGVQLNGWAFTQVNGTVHWDKSGIVTRGLSAQQRTTNISPADRLAPTVIGRSRRPRS